MPTNSQTVCPAGWTQDGEECKKTVTASETCYLDSSLGSPPCFGSGGVIKPPSAPAPPNGYTPPPKKKPAFLQECSEVIQGYHANIVQNIKELQSYEKTLFDKLYALETSGVSTNDQNTLISQINTISSTRTNLFLELQAMLKQEQCTLSNDRYDLADQIALLSVTEAELNRIKSEMAALRQNRNNKLRMVEITNYEEDRYSAHKAIFKNVAFCALGIIMSLYLVKNGWPNLGRSGVVISIVVGIILTVGSIWDAWWRSPMNWNRYQQPTAHLTSNKQYETVWQHDVNAFWKGIDQVSDETAYLAGKTGSDLSKINQDIQSGGTGGGGTNNPCPSKWFWDSGSSKCVQTCPDDAQQRTSNGRCICGYPGTHNQNCISGATCMDNTCV